MVYMMRRKVLFNPQTQKRQKTWLLFLFIQNRWQKTRRNI